MDIVQRCTRLTPYCCLRFSSKLNNFKNQDDYSRSFVKFQAGNVKCLWLFLRFSFTPLTHLFPLPLVSVRRLRVFEAADCKVLGFAPLQLSPSFILSPFSLSLSLGK